MPVKKDNKTRIEKDDNITKVEEESYSSDESGRRETQAGGSGVKVIKLGGSVYEVEQRLYVASAEADLYLVKSASGERCVLKYYRPKVEPKPEVIELMRSFSGRGAVRIIETGREAGRFYEIQEYAAHGTLSDLMKKHKPVPRDILIAFLKNAADCLFEIHSKDLIHRDIKPENILVRNIEPLDIAFTDFGISSISKLSLNQRNMNRTILYSSPESMSGVISKGTDYWSLGMILLEMAVGTNPFEGVADKVVMFTLATKTVPGVMDLKSEFSEIIKGLLTRNPKKRWGHKEVSAWLNGEKNIPVFFGEMSDDAILPRTLHPYRFDGENYFTLRDMTVPMAEKWDLAKNEFGSGSIRNWVARELGDKEMLAVMEDIANDKASGPDEKLFEFFCRANGGFPFIFRGILINEKALIELASKIIKKSASPDELNFMRDIFKLNIIKKYAGLNNDDSIYKLFGGVMETCASFIDPADLAAAVLAHFVDEYRQAMIEKTRDIFENCYILDKPRGAEHEDMMNKARVICSGGQFSIADLIRASKIGKLDHIKKLNFDSIVTGLKNKFIELDEENRIKSYKEMFSDDDWKVVTELVRNNTVEYSRPFYEKISGIKKLLDGGPPVIDRKISEIYSKDNYIVVSELPLEVVEPQPVKSPDRSKIETPAEVIGHDRAKPRARLNALLGDMGLAMLSFLLSVTILIFTSNEPVSLALIEAFHNRFFLGFFLLYIPISEYLFSASPGKIMFDLAVAGPDDRKISFFRSFFRSLTRFAILSFYGCLTLSIYKFLLAPDFPASYLDYRSILFFMAFYAGGIFDYIFMYFRRSQSPSYETITGCSVVERRYNTGWTPTILMTAASIAVIIIAWGFLLVPHFDLKTMSFERYTWRYFIDPGSENGVKYNAGKLEIIIAADRGELDLVKLLLYSHPEYAGVTDENGFSALFFAAQKGNDEIVKLLLDNKVEVNSVGNLMETALTAACATGNSKIVKMLCAKKADVNFRNAQGQTPLIIAVMGKFSDAAKILVESSANLELKDENGFTALMMAAFTSDTRMFEYLLSKGADINAADLKGHTSLMIAAVKNNFEIAKMLVNRECNINARGGPSEATALIAAIQFSNSKIAEMLIDKSKDLNISDNAGNSPLMVAAAKGDLWAVTTLIRHGADLNHQNNDGNAALMVAASATNEKILKILISAGAKPGLKNKAGYTALQMYNGMIEVRRATTATTAVTTADTTTTTAKTPVLTKTTTTTSTPESVSTSSTVKETEATTTFTQGIIRENWDVIVNPVAGVNGVRVRVRPQAIFSVDGKPVLVVEKQIPGQEYKKVEYTRNAKENNLANFKGPAETTVNTEKTVGPTEYTTQQTQNSTQNTTEHTTETIDTFGGIQAEEKPAAGEGK